MGVLEDKHGKLIKKKVIPSCFLVLLFLTRFLPFYEIEGIRVEVGFGSIEFHKILFGTVILMFLIGTWKDNISIIIRFILQSISIFVMVLYDVIYLFLKDYELKYTCIGFWLHVIFSILTIGYCLFYREQSCGEM